MLEKDKDDKDSKIFLEFHYPEIKDLCIHFLTLISGILAFSVVFSDKMIDFNTAHFLARSSIILAWILFIVAISACGTGLLFIFGAAEQATGSIIYDYRVSFKKLTKISYVLLNISGVAFGTGLILLVFTAILKFYSR